MPHFAASEFTDISFFVDLLGFAPVTFGPAASLCEHSGLSNAILPLHVQSWTKQTQTHERAWSLTYVSTIARRYM